MNKILKLINFVIILLINVNISTSENINTNSEQININNTDNLKNILNDTKLILPLQTIIKDYVGFSNWQAKYILTDHKAGIISLAMTSKGNMLASACEDNVVKLWQLDTGACIKTINFKEKIYRLSISPDKKYLAILFSSGIISIYNIDSETFLYQLSCATDFKNTINNLSSNAEKYGLDSKSWICHGIALYCIPSLFSISPDNKCLYLEIDEFKKKWDIENGITINYDSSPNKCNCGLISECNKYNYNDTSYNSSKEKDNIFWSIERDCYFNKLSYKYDSNITNPLLYITPQSISNNKKYFATIHENDKKSVIVKFIDEVNPNDDQEYKKLLKEREKLIFQDRDNLSKEEEEELENKIKKLDELLEKLDDKNAFILNTLTGHSDIITSIIVSDDGQYIVSGSLDKTIRIWHNNELNL